MVYGFITSLDDETTKAFFRSKRIPTNNIYNTGGLGALAEDLKTGDDPDRPILKTLYSRYLKAEEILKNNEEIKKIMISGGCRAYLDAFSDYMNPLLIEMDKAEKMISELKL